MCVPYGEEHTCVALQRCTTRTRTTDTQFHCRRYPLFARGSGEQLIGIFALVRSCGLHMARRFRNDTDVVFARARDKKKKKELFEGGSTSFERESISVTPSRETICERVALWNSRFSSHRDLSRYRTGGRKCKDSRFNNLDDNNDSVSGNGKNVATRSSSRAGTAMWH